MEFSCERDPTDGAFRWGRSGDDIFAEWEGILSLRATRDGQLLSLQPAPGASADVVEKTRLGLATAFLRVQRQQQSLHGSAVAYGARALVCVGASGLGKSTLAQRLCQQSGVALLGDDVTGIQVLSTGEIRVLPSEASVWLAGASRDKAPVRLPAAHDSASLSCLVVLGFRDDASGSIECRQVRGADAVSAVLPSIVRFELTGAQWARELEFLGKVVAGTRIMRLTRARNVPPDDVARALFSLLSAEAP